MPSLVISQLILAIMGIMGIGIWPFIAIGFMGMPIPFIPFIMGMGMGMGMGIIGIWPFIPIIAIGFIGMPIMPFIMGMGIPIMPFIGIWLFIMGMGMGIIGIAFIMGVSKVWFALPVQPRRGDLCRVAARHYKPFIRRPLLYSAMPEKRAAAAGLRRGVSAP